MIDNIVLSETLRQIGKARVLCVGDVILDKFIYGGIERISREAPIPILVVSREKQMLGGAGNAVANLAALGAKVALVAATGRDGAGLEIQNLLKEQNVAAQLVEVAGRSTTVKNRFISGGQQMLRVDYEKTCAVSKDTEDKIIAAAVKEIETADAVVLSDYNNGLLTDRIVSSVIEAARKKSVPVIVDPRGHDFARYRGATAITPNLAELETGSGMKARSEDEVRAACMKIIKDCGIATVLATRGKDGMSLISENGAPVHIPAQVREVYDVSGAGDTVIAAFAAALAVQAAPEAAARLANIAAGIVVGKAGTATASPDEIETAIAAEKTATKNKALSWAAAQAQVERWKVRGSTVGFTNGTFDLLHPGHLSSIRQAKAACDYLVVGLNSDASVKRYKGPTRPLQDENTRAAVLAALEMVDLVVVFEQDTPLELMLTLKPDVVVKGAQYKAEELPGYAEVTAYGGRFILADMQEGFSTTNTVKKIAG